MKLFNNYIVNTFKSSKYLGDSFGVVFEHQYLENIDDPEDWSPLMIYDGFIKSLDLQLELFKKNLLIHDPVPENFTYNNNFLLLDFGSISRFDRIIVGKNPIYWNINQFFYNKYVPSFFERLVKSSINSNDFFKNKINNTLYGFFNYDERNIYEEIRKKLFVLSENRLFNNAYSLIKKYIEDFKPKINFDIVNFFNTSYIENNISEFELKYVDLINTELDKKVLVLFLGKNIEKNFIKILSRICIHKNNIFIANNSKEMTDSLYYFKKEKNLNNIRTLFTDLFSENNAHQKNSICDFHKRYKVNSLIAFDVFSNLIFDSKLNFDEIFKCFSELTENFLVFDFDKKINNFFSVDFLESLKKNGYNFKNMMKYHDKYFIAKKILTLKDNRYIILSKKKSRILGGKKL